MTIPGEMIFFCDEEFTTCGGYETDKFEDFVKILNAVDEATSDEDVIDYFLIIRLCTCYIRNY